jgi:hypothetical protein
MHDSYYKERFKRNTLKKYGTPQQIRAVIKQLRNDKKVVRNNPERRSGWNIAGYQYGYFKI